MRMAGTSENKVTKLCVNRKAVSALIGAANLHIDSCAVGVSSVSVTAHPTRRTCPCPSCGRRSGSVHSEYVRTLMSLPVHSLRVTLSLRARKFRCRNPECGRKVFSERLEGLAGPYSRVTTEARSLLERILVEVSAEKGSLIAGYIGLPRSPSTCLRTVRVAPLPPVDRSAVTRVRIDDFALRRGQTYGTMLMDADTGSVLDIVAGRSEEAASALLAGYPNIAVASRDRAGAYASALSGTHPGAAQVADRFHLVKNCLDSLSEQLRISRGALAAEAADILRGDITAGLTGEEAAARDRVMSRAYYPRISGLLDRGESADEIARRHHYSRSAVAECAREWRRGAPEGIRALAERIVGGRSLRLLLSDPDHGADRETGVVTGEAAAVDSVISRSPSLSALREYATSLRALLRERDAHGLDGWIDRHAASPFERVASFARGLRTDRDAVANALTHDISNGPMEGANNKLKAIKRSMYGRAGIDLLMRKMILAKRG